VQDSNSGKLKLERDAQHAILLHFGALPWVRIWRQNTGKAYGYSIVAGAIGQMKNGNFRAGYDLLKHAQLTTYGTPGSADIQGLLGPRTGSNGGRFLAIEVKGAQGVQSDEQIAWQAMIEAKGGIYILAKTVEDVQVALRGYGYPA